MLETEFVPDIERIAPYLSSAPVDLDAMAAILGIEVVQRSLPPNVSGRLERRFGGGWRITLNSRHSKTRRRFTLAHEIAHYLLHRDLVGDFIEDDDRYRSTTLPEALEVQASRFGASLLLPSALVTSAVRAGEREPEAIARRFGVSSSIAELRLREIGITEAA